MRSSALSVLSAICFFGNLSAYAFEQCKGDSPKVLEVSGKWQGTGLVRCIERDDGRKTKDITFKDSVPVYIKYWAIDGKKLSEEYEQTLRDGYPIKHGAYKRYHRNGILNEDCLYKSAEQYACKTFNEQGQLSSIRVGTEAADRTAIYFNPDGSLSEAYCSKHWRDAFEKQLCGLDGKESKVVEFRHNKKQKSRIKVFKNGEVLSTVSFDENGNVESERTGNAGTGGVLTEKYANGQVKLQRQFNSAGKTEGEQKEFSEEGELTREVVFKDGVLQKETLYYLNGQKKKVTERKGSNPVSIHVEEFFDNGQVQEKGTFLEKRVVTSYGYGHLWSRDDMIPTGAHTSWNEAGEPVASRQFSDGEYDGQQVFYLPQEECHRLEQNYKKGTKKSEKCFGADGEMIRFDEFFADGSKKRHSVSKTK